MSNKIIRSQVYGILDELRAEEFPEAVPRLIQRVRERRYSGDGLTRLGYPPPEAITAVGEWVRETIADPNSMVIRVFGYFGPRASAYLDVLAEICLNAKLDVNDRCASGKALVQIGGIEHAMEQLQKIDAASDPVGEMMVIDALAYHFLNLKGEDKPDGAYQKEFKRRVLRQLESPLLEFREWAFELLPYAFGEDFIVFDSPTQYRLNPQAEQVLEKMAANDPNEGLRSRAGRWLDELHEEWVDIYAKGILRKREQEKEKAASDSPKP